MSTKAAIKYLNVQLTLTNPITIKEAYIYEVNVIRNDIWYRREP